MTKKALLLNPILNSISKTLSEARAQNGPPAYTMGQASSGHAKDGLRWRAVLELPFKGSLGAPLKG